MTYLQYLENEIIKIYGTESFGKTCEKCIKYFIENVKRKGKERDRGSIK